MIDDLPQAALDHTEPGHFQMDTVHSSDGRSGLLTLVAPYHVDPEEPRRFYMYFLPALTQDAVTAALRHFRRDLRANGHELKTLLTDNGPEFLHADKIEASLRAPSTTATPIAPGRKAPSSAITASCAPTTTNPPTSPSRALTRSDRPTTSSSTTHAPPKRSPNPCVFSKSSQTHCANQLTFYSVVPESSATCPTSQPGVVVSPSPLVELTSVVLETIHFSSSG